MAPRLWLWLHVATAMVAVSFPYRHERHAHIRRFHAEHHPFLGNFLLNGTSGKDSHIGLGRPAEHTTPYEGVAQSTPPGRSTRRHQRHRHRRRLHSRRVPDIIYSFGNHSAAKLYPGKGYRVGPYTGYVDVWTIPRHSPLRPLLGHRETPPPSPPRHQRQQEHFSEGTAFANVLIAVEPANAVTPSQLRPCFRCPKDRTVWVGPGFTCAEVPKPRLRPCSRRMSLPGDVHITATVGPQPGSLVMEGVYQMSFTLQAPGMAPQSCHYKLRVKVRRCPALRRPQHGGVRCSRGRHWGSRCRFFCKKGYKLEQRVATRCAIHDGVQVTWTPHPAPICRDKNASSPNAVTNAVVPSTVVLTRPTTEPSVPTTTSIKRFPSTRTPRPPKRRKQLACRWPKAPPHGWVWCDRGATRKARVVAREGTRCRQGCRWAPLNVVTHFSCVAGVWQGRKVLDCATPPELPQTTEEPAPQGCALPATTPGGRWSCSDGGPLVAPGAECAFVCDQDYQPVAENPAQLARRCLGEHWNHTAVPVCKKSGCNSPQPGLNATLKCSADVNTLGMRPVGTICRHICDNGYEISQSQLPLAEVSCLANGQWDRQDQPQCVGSGCASPAILPNSVLNCSNPVNPTGNWPTGTTCNIMCDEGFSVPPNQHSLNEIVCQGDGTWNQMAQLECNESGCASPDPVPDSSLECSETANHLGRYPTGALCKVVCKEGLALPPDMQSLNQFVCQEDGTWNQTQTLECSNSGCSSPNAVPGASLECSENAGDLEKWPPGTTCHVVCDDGLALPPSLQSFSSFVCQEDRTWNQSAQLECRETGCAHPDVVPDSSLKCSNDANHLGNRPTGTLCEVQCNEGFTLPLDLQSSSRFVCQEDGMWNQTVHLDCLKSGCANLDPARDSSLQCSNEANGFGNRPAGTVCKVVCSKGYTLPSNQLSFSEFVCQEDGTWDHDTHLECHRVTCDNPPNRANAVLECSNGTSQDGKWAVGTLCRYVCNDGYTLPKMQDGLDSFVCSEDGTWSITDQLFCEEAGCKSPTQVEDAILNCTSEANSLGRWPAGTMCSYDCKEGYGLAKSQLLFNRFMCHDDGTWNYTEKLRCQKTGCEDPSAVQFSMVNCSGSVNTLGRWPVATECSHVCDEGYAVSRHEVHLNLFICLDDGTWNQTEGLHCRETGCQEPGKVPHSVINCSSDFNVLGKRPFGTVCSYVCNEGFAVPVDLEQHNQFVCSEDGSWSQKEELLCLKTGCESPRAVQNSVLQCSQTVNVVGNWPAGTTCEHICDKGFVIPLSQRDLNKFICHDNGKWNETDDLQCVELRDPQLSQGCKHEVVVVDGRNVSFPVVAEAPMFEAFNGTNAVVNCSATQVMTYGTHIIVCDAFDSELLSMSSCTYNLTVVASGCPPLQSDPYSRVSCSVDHNVTEGQLHPVGDVCEYICQEHGYVIPQSKVDSAVKECMPNGSWSNDDFNLCQKQLKPVLVSGCQKFETSTNQPNNTAVPLPVFRTGSGQLVNATCTPEIFADYGKYNVTCVAEDPELRSPSTPCVFQVIVKGDAIPRRLRPGQDCVDVEEVHDKYPAHVKLPAFEAASGGVALVTCDPATLLGPGAYNVTCTARDNKTQAETQCSYVVNARQIEQFRESQCLSLRAPANGNIQCKRRKGLITCRFSCLTDHVMNTKSLPLLARGYVVCDRAQGDRFDFQEEYGLDELPACTRLPSPTYFQSSLTFYVGLPSCTLEELHADFMPTLTEALLDRAADVCLQAVCDNVTFMCETGVRRNISDPTSTSDAMKVVWTVQARHNVNESYDIPEAETMIEQIQVLTHDIVTSDPTFYQEIAKVGGDLWRDSFHQSDFKLVCSSRGFTIDDHTAHCVQCPSGTFEEHGSCSLCPQNHYQDSEGQTSCKPCPKHTFSFKGAKMIKDCTEFGGPYMPPPARDAPTRQLYERHGPCSPNPCQNQGICYLQRGGYTCLCQQHYRGRHCEESA
nr:sushi, von Willebrand factor type A, EGF and pentraxin domain-containing protein 1-like isoform X2 [Rhipicephalus microplus]